MSQATDSILQLGQVRQHARFPPATDRSHIDRALRAPIHPESVLFPCRSVDLLAEKVGVTSMPGVLPNHVDGNPAKIDRFVVPKARRRSVEIGERGGIASRGCARLLPMLQHVFRRVAIQIGPGPVSIHWISLT